MIMKTQLTLSLLALGITASSAAGITQSPGKGVALPKGFESFFPVTAQPDRARFIGEADGSTLPGTPMPRMFRHNETIRQNAPEIKAGNLYGFLTNTSIENLEYGLYDVNPATAGSTFLWQDELTAWGWDTYTGWLRDGILCTLSGVKLQGQFMGYAYLEFDLSDGTILTTEYLNPAEGMERVYISSGYRTLDDTLYGYTYNEEGDAFCFSKAPARDINAVRIIKDVNIKEVCSAMVYNSVTDEMYGVTTQGMFVKIDTDGNQTEIYNLSRSINGLQSGAVSGMAWSATEQACIYNAYLDTQGTVFFALDPTGKQAPRRMGASKGAEIYTVLVSPEVNGLPDAPVPAVFDSYDFTGDSLDGSLTWTLPSKLIEGTAIQGNVDWTLYIDGKKVKNGSGTPGARLTTDAVSVSNGQHTFALVCSVEGYSSEPVVYRHWTGPDAPLPPLNAKITENLISWDVPEGSEHDGYINPSEFEYTVYLNGERLGSTNSTSYGYTLPQGQPFNSYTAEITATYKGWESDRAVSNFITYGEPLRLPIHYRPEEKELELMTLINVDGHKFSDGRDDTWRFTTNMGFPSFTSGYNGDDWLIFPPMYFDNTEKAYRFEMEIGLIHDMDTTGTYEVCIGTEPTAEAMTRVIIPESHCLHMLGDILEEFFAVPEAGVYYIGIHAITHKVGFHVSDIDFKLSDRPANVPVGVSGFEVIPAEDAVLSAKVNFTLPTITATGAQIPADKMITATVCSYATEAKLNAERTLTETKTVEGLPGSTHTLDITTAQNYNIITVECSFDGMKGKATESDFVYCGVDRPYTVNDLQATVSEDNMSMHLTWTPPTRGEENGPIGDTFLYLIYDYISSSWTYTDEAGWDVYEYTYTVDEDTPLGYYSVGVMAYNAAGLSYSIVGQSAALGEPMQIPFVNDLDNNVTYDNAVIARPDEQYDDTYWIPDDPAKIISPMFELPSKFAFIGYTYEAVDRKTRLALPKFATAGFTDAVLTFGYWGGEHAATMRLIAEYPGCKEPVLICELPKDPKGWTEHTVTLPAALQDQGWVHMFVDADLPDDQQFAMISGYSVMSLNGVDAVSALGGAEIKSGRGFLSVNGLAGESLIVADMAGRTVLRRDSLGSFNTFSLPAGIYIVRAGAKTAKVVVR